MLYSEIIAVCSQIHTKHINTVCGQNVVLLNVKLVACKITIKIPRVSRAFWTCVDGVCPCLHLACNYIQ